MVFRELRNEAGEMKSDPVTLQIISNSLLYASEEMGLALRNSAYSPNIKERMDHSAAVFDPEGRLLAQAEHIPVHLGSLPWGLRNLIDWCAREGKILAEGTMLAANDPYVTGTHLNDMTVVAPVYYNGVPVAYVVNKAHHSDVGGAFPGSISMAARTLADEGFVLEPSMLLKGGSFVKATVEKFASASRTPAERRGDLKAQVAANISGGRRVLALVEKYGVEPFRLAAAHSFAHSESLSRKRIARFRSGVYRASEYLEGPHGEELELKAKVSITGKGVEIDYSGTSAEVDFPLNAVFGVTLSGAYFVLRCLLGDDIPANHGAFSAVRVSAPEGTVLNPTSPHPVGGGNVETSQRNADLIFRALAPAARGAVPAASGGSMNNVMMGGGRGRSAWAFYETIGVGLGGGRGRDGVDGIQANMTNTMNTPIEEMERAFPIRMVRYELRPDSAGAGTFRGGSGLVRAYRALRPNITFTVVAERERRRPWGLDGGLEGAGTEVTLEHEGARTRIPSKSTLTLQSDDVVEIRTAGGGGFGSPAKRDRRGLDTDIKNGLLSRERAWSDYPVRKE